jgi:hypothetical protein
MTDSEWESRDAAVWRADGSHQVKQPRILVHKTGGRLHWWFSSMDPTRAHIRWQGPEVQWVISPRQIALWTDFQNRHPERNGPWPYNWRFHWSPGVMPICPSRRNRKQGPAAAGS